MLNHDMFGDDIYRQNILDHNASPRNKRRMENATWCRRDRNTSCGDDIEVFVRENGDSLAELTFDGVGCAVSQAAASMLSEKVEGLPLADIAKMGKSDIDALLGIDVGPARIKCALLALTTLQKGLAERHRSDTH